jgi:hypothetical protein
MVTPTPAASRCGPAYAVCQKGKDLRCDFQQVLRHRVCSGGLEKYEMAEPGSATARFALDARTWPHPGGSGLNVPLALAVFTRPSLSA